MSNLEKFASSSMRGSRRGIYQQLLASLLVKAVKSNDPLEKIQALCEAAYTCRIKDKLDMKLIDVCFEVCESFRNHQKQRREGAHYISVSWSFQGTEENYERFISPWSKQSAAYIPWFTPLARKLYPTEIDYRSAKVSLSAEEMEEERERKRLEGCCRQCGSPFEDDCLCPLKGEGE